MKTIFQNVRGLLLGALLAVSLVAAPAHAELVDRIAAVVNDQVIAQSEVEQRAAPELARLNELPDPARRAEVRRELMKQALDGLIGEKLMESQMKELGITVSDQEAAAGVEEMRVQNKLSPEQWEQALRSEGYSPAQYRALIKDALGKRKLINLKVRPNVKVSDADLRAAYQQLSKIEGAEFEVKARHILVQVAPDASPAEVEKAKQKAQALAEQARAKDVDFAQLAKQKSEGPSAAEGGDLGTFRRGVMLPEFERVAFKLPVGGISEPVRTRHGFHVIKVEERKALGAPPFDDVKDQLRAKLEAEQLQKMTLQYIDELRQKATVELKSAS